MIRPSVMENLIAAGVLVALAFFTGLAFVGLLWLLSGATR